MRIRGDMELHPFTVAFGDLAVTFTAYYLVADRVAVEGFESAMATALPWLGLCSVFALHTLNLTMIRGRSGRETVRAAAVSSLIVGSLAMFGFLLLTGLPFRVETLVYPVLAQLLAVVGWRALSVQIGRLLRGRRMVLVVGEEAETSYLIDKLHESGSRGYEAVAVTTSAQSAMEQLGRVNSVLLGPSVPHADKTALLAACLVSGRECLVVPDSYEVSLCQAEVRQLLDLPVLAIRPIGLGRVQQLAKRILDLIIAAIMLVLLQPVWLVVALAIRLTSPGPIFYAQERLGRGSRPFQCLKFRTMVENAEADSGPVLASAVDPRITPVGRFLRATRLDETPQLLNVLRGEMSVVGPRPERAFFVEQISQTLPDYRFRLLVQPGMTGLAQVEAGYAARPEDKLRYDLLYIQNYSLLLDLRILLATVRVVLFPGQHEGIPTAPSLTQTKSD